VKADARHPVYIGRILEHASGWGWFRLDRAVNSAPPGLQPGDRIRVRPVNEDSPFRTGECRVLGTFDDFVHVERGAWQDIAAIADMDHVYLTERGDRRHPYAPGEKMTDRHPDSVIAQVVEETIEKQVAFLEQPHPTPKLVQKRTGYQPLPAQPEPAFRMCEQDGALYVDTKDGPIKVTADPTVRSDEVRFAQPAPIPESVIAARDELVRRTHEAMGIPADVFRGVDRSATPAKLSGATLQKSAPATPSKQWVTPLVYEDRPELELAPLRRPDGFDQRQVDAARAALLAPAPPRYPRAR